MRFVADKRGPAGAASALAGCTLLVPSVSAGNVGQLAADLAVGGLGLVRLGWLDDPHHCVLPVAGADAYQRGDDRGATLHAGIEVYGPSSPPNGGAVCVVQVRAPVVPGMRGSFTSGLAAWAASALPARVVVLAGSTPDGPKAVAEVGAPPSPGVPASLGFGGLVAILSPGAAKDFSNLADGPSFATLDGPSDALGLREGSLTVGLFRSLSEQREGALPVLLAAALVAEGDNVPDAVALLSAVSDALGLGVDPRAPFPPSWAALHGSRPDASLF